MVGDPIQRVRFAVYRRSQYEQKGSHAADERRSPFPVQARSAAEFGKNHADDNAEQGQGNQHGKHAAPPMPSLRLGTRFFSPSLGTHHRCPLPFTAGIFGMSNPPE